MIDQDPKMLTKMIATIGPASCDEAVIRRLIEESVDVFRLNFSHGSLEDHAEVLGRIRKVCEDMGIPVGVLGDLCGPKIRLGPSADPAGMPIEPGQVLVIQREETETQDLRASTNYARFVSEVDAGHRVLIDDGALRFVITKKESDEVHCQCIVGGVIQSRKGVNLPDTMLSVGSITERDRECIRWAVENRLDYVGLSFTRSADDVNLLRDLLGEEGTGIDIIAKIERPEAVKDIDAIINASDVIMVARGDMGVEMELEQVPLIQKDLIERCRKAARPVIVATQMLQTMIDAAAPTRAEVSDVANAIFDGADTVMLSGETAVGINPAAAVSTMRSIARATERYLREHDTTLTKPVPPVSIRHQKESLARAAWLMAHDVKPRKVVIWSESGGKARVLSKLRLHVPVVALSSDPRVVRQMNLYYGVIPVLMKAPASITELAPRVEVLMRTHRWADDGDVLLLLGSTTLGRPADANAVMIHKMGERD